MIVSMTGYGRGVHIQNGVEISVELRSFNNRFLDVSVRVPKILSHYDQLIKDKVRKYVVRGRVNVSIVVKSTDNPYVGLKADMELARAYKKIFDELKKDLKITGEITLEQLLSLPDIICMEDEEEAADELWKIATKALEKALGSLNEMREQEGKELAKDLSARIRVLNKTIKEIDSIAKERPQKMFQKLQDRVQNLIEQGKIDNERLEQELAIIIDRMDVTEESVRFNSHNKLFLDSIKSEEPSGRRLNFILQEMNREANTIGAKANDKEISHLVVDLKEEIEKIREQVQNIE